MELLLALFLIAMLAFLLWASRNNLISGPKALEIWYEEALQEFKATVVVSASGDLSFNGNLAEIVKVEKTGGVTQGGVDRSTFTVVIFAKNPAGEYFMFRKTATDRPFFKHVEKRIAISALHLNKNS